MTAIAAMSVQTTRSSIRYATSLPSNLNTHSLSPRCSHPGPQPSCVVCPLLECAAEADKGRPCTARARLPAGTRLQRRCEGKRVHRLVRQAACYLPRHPSPAPSLALSPGTSRCARLPSAEMCGCALLVRTRRLASRSEVPLYRGHCSMNTSRHARTPASVASRVTSYSARARDRAS